MVTGDAHLVIVPRETDKVRRPEIEGRREASGTVRAVLEPSPKRQLPRPDIDAVGAAIEEAVLTVPVQESAVVNVAETVPTAAREQAAQEARPSAKA